MTTFFVPFSPPPFHFVTTLKGFIFLNESDKESEQKVTEIVCDTLFPTDKSDTGLAIRRIVASHKDNIPTPINNIETAICFLRSSVRIKHLNLVKKEDIGTGEGSSHPAWNLYIFPPTTNNITLREWRTLIQRTTFVTNTNRAGKTLRLFKCSICRSIDHPGGTCPYPTQRGWTPPTPTTSPTLVDLLNPPQPSNEQPNARNGNRGRGRTGNIRGRGQRAAGNRANARN